MRLIIIRLLRLSFSKWEGIRELHSPPSPPSLLPTFLIDQCRKVKLVHMSCIQAISTSAQGGIVGFRFGLPWLVLHSYNIITSYSVVRAACDSKSALWFIRPMSDTSCPSGKFVFRNGCYFPARQLKISNVGSKEGGSGGTEAPGYLPILEKDNVRKSLIIINRKFR